MRFYYESLKLTPYSRVVQQEKTGGNSSFGGDIRNGTNQFVVVPTGILVAKDIFQSPKAWIGMCHNVEQYTDIRGIEKGGHFLKLENPSAVVKDLKKFVFNTLGASKDKNGIHILKERRKLAFIKEKVTFFLEYSFKGNIIILYFIFYILYFVFFIDSAMSSLSLSLSLFICLLKKDRSSRMASTMELLGVGIIGLLIRSRL
jgi:hypothetical protein